MNDHTGPIRAIVGRPLVTTVRVLVLLLISMACGVVALNTSTATTIYETYFNPAPLIRYPDSDDPNDRGLPSDKAFYTAGDTVALTISRAVRVEGTLTNLIYLSATGEPRGVLLNTLSSSVPAGYSSRRADVALIPPDTKTGIYCLAGVQTIVTKYGTLSVPWRSTWFYVSERKDS